MLVDLDRSRIFLVSGVTDLRKSYHGLSGIVGKVLEQDPFSGHLFLFRNKRGNLIKILYWQRNGFCVWQKRLDREKFPWVFNNKPIRELTPEELDYLLRGINIFSGHREYFPRWA